MEEIKAEVKDLDTKEVALSDLEKQAIIKYEKEGKPYRKTTINTATQIKCVKCGSPYSLMKAVDNEGNKLYFCKNCVMQRARELRRQGKI